MCRVNADAQRIVRRTQVDGHLELFAERHLALRDEATRSLLPDVDTSYQCGCVRLRTVAAIWGLHKSSGSSGHSQFRDEKGPPLTGT